MPDETGVRREPDDLPSERQMMALATRVAHGDLDDASYFDLIDRRASNLVEREAPLPRLFSWIHRRRRASARRRAHRVRPGRGLTT
ncbi:hypothetical protein ACSNOI_33675 [Actinomadura kijaniata]|uniref:hypothetical protein n=1 Tax=Actinomadura kijaniata TaxID=46161 RepID=UPI003F19AC0A